MDCRCYCGRAPSSMIPPPCLPCKGYRLRWEYEVKKRRTSKASCGLRWDVAHTVYQDHCLAVLFADFYDISWGLSLLQDMPLPPSSSDDLGLNACEIAPERVSLIAEVGSGQFGQVRCQP